MINHSTKRILGFIVIAIAITGTSYGQCPSAGANITTPRTITANCTVSGSLSVTGTTLTVNPGVVLTVTGTLTVQGGGTINATGATINAGTLSEAYSNQSFTGGTYNIGSFSSGSGGTISISGVTMNISNNPMSFSGSSLTINNSTFTGVTNWGLNLDNFANLTNTNVTASGNIEFEVGTITGGTYTAGVSANFRDGTMTFNGATLDIGDSNPGTTGLDAMSFNGSAIVNFTNGTQVEARGDLNAGNGADIIIDNSDVSVTGNFDNAGTGLLIVRNDGNLYVGGNFDNSGTGSVSIEDGALMSVTGNYINTGGGTSTDVDGGTLVVGGTFSGNAPTGDAGSCGVGGGGCCGAGCSALPVSLIDFKHSLDGNLVKLEWNTASELNNDFFTLERSVDGINFQIVATIVGAGTTNEMVSYQYLDRASLSGSAYYRLSQTDYDGTHEYLGVIYVKSSQVDSQLKVFPNPVINVKSIQLVGVQPNTQWNIYSLSGEVVLSGTLEKSTEVSVDGLKAGTYVLKMIGERPQSTILLVR